MDEESQKRTISSSVSATNFIINYSINIASTPSPLEKAYGVFANKPSMVIPSEVEESPYKQICTPGDFSIPLPSVAPLELTVEMRFVRTMFIIFRYRSTAVRSRLVEDAEPYNHFLMLVQTYVPNKSAVSKFLGFKGRFFKNAPLWVLG